MWRDPFAADDRRVPFLFPPAWYFRVPAGRVEIRLTTANPTALEAQVSLAVGDFIEFTGRREFNEHSLSAPLSLRGVATFVNPSDPWEPTVPID
jgi:hypothetical protein